MSKNSTKEKVIDNIIDNYISIEESIVSQLYMKNDLHGTTVGTQRENVWKQLFEMIIPKKFVIEESIFIIDSNYDLEKSTKSQEGISKEVDLAIIDENYTPYIFRYGKLKFVPIEAIAAVVECKSTSSTKEDLKSWIERIEKLNTSDIGIARMSAKIMSGKTNPAQKATKPIKIFCGLSDTTAKGFDFKIIARKDEKNLEIEMTDKDRNLYEWHKHLNSAQSDKLDGDDFLEYTLQKYVVEKDENEISLLTFNFQLNQLLMIINNPMLFPHLAYVNMFNKLDK
jgi:hypothetical protein